MGKKLHSGLATAIWHDQRHYCFVTVKKGKKLQLYVTANPASSKLTVKKHTAVRFESTNTKKAAVSKKGVITGKAKGTYYVYAYAQNGMYKKIKVTVK